MKKLKWAIATTLSIGVLSLGLADSATAQYLGQEHIDRGTMDRNRRSRGQTRTLWGNPSETNETPSSETSTSDNRRLETYSDRGPGVYLGVIELVNGTLPRDRAAFEAALDAMEWEIIPSGMTVTPTGRIVADKFLPVRIDSTGQTGVVFVRQLRVAE